MGRIPTRKITLTNKQAVDLLEGLNVISQGRQITVDGKNVPRGFVFEGKTGGDLRYTLARAAILLKPIIETFKLANDQIFRDHATDAAGAPNIAEDKDGKERVEVPVSRSLEYGKAVEELFGRSTEPIEFPVLCYEHLNVGDDKAKGQNPIPPNALAALDPILVWTQADYDAAKESKPAAIPEPTEG